MPERLIDNKVNCSKCGAPLIVRCSQGTGSAHQHGDGGFFGFTCPTCHQWNSAVRLAGQAIDSIQPNLVTTEP